MKPKPTPKHPRTPARTTAAVGKLMWAVKAVVEKAPESFYVFTTPPLPGRLLTPVLVLPADKEGVEKLRKKIQYALIVRGPDETPAGCVMRVLGIPPHAATGRGKGKT